MEFKTRDKIKVVNYGEYHWNNQGCPSCNGSGEWVDAMPDIVGREGEIDTIEFAAGETLYSVKGIPEKARWYKENQLALL